MAPGLTPAEDGASDAQTNLSIIMQQTTRKSFQKTKHVANKPLQVWANANCNGGVDGQTKKKTTPGQQSARVRRKSRDPPQEKRARPPRHLRQEGLEGRVVSHMSHFSHTHTHTLLSSTPALHAAIKKTVKSKNQYLARWEGSHTHTQTKAGRREEARGRTKGGGTRRTGVQRRRYRGT